jgi:hypothetical protein
MAATPPPLTPIFAFIKFINFFYFIMELGLRRSD